MQCSSCRSGDSKHLINDSYSILVIIPVFFMLRSHIFSNWMRQHVCRVGNNGIVRNVWENIMKTSWVHDRVYDGECISP